MVRSRPDPCTLSVQQNRDSVDSESGLDPERFSSLGGSCAQHTSYHVSQ